MLQDNILDSILLDVRLLHSLCQTPSCLHGQAGGVDPAYLRSKHSIATEKRANGLLKQHKEQEKLRIMGLSSIKTALRAFETILADRDDNYTVC